MFIAARLAPWMMKMEGEGRRHVQDGISLMMKRGVHADAGQLLYLLDAYHFARFLRRFSTSRRDENYRTFVDPSRWRRAAEKPQVLQWQNTKAVKRTQKTSLPVVR